MSSWKRSSGKLAEEYNDKGNRFSETGEADKAIASFKKAIESAPHWAVPYFNLGLVYKHKHQWEDCLKCNEKAIARDPRDEGAIWNLGIAATALGNWTKAREAWTRYGIDLPTGDGPINGDFGTLPIRINPNEAGEVVWCKRIDPARAIIQSIPFAESGHRYGDLLLHDGEPKGYRMVGTQQVPVFNELQILMPSEFGTYLIGLENTSAEEVESLKEAFDEQELAAENWQTNTRVICRACSEGKPFGEDHQHPERPAADDNLIVLAVAATSPEQVESIVNAWLPQHAPAQMTEIECVVKPAFLT